jgi:hypothetical protein
MTLRLTDEETALLREQAEREHRSMHEVAPLAVLDRIARSQRTDAIRSATRDVMQRDAEALRLLAE